MSEKEKVALRYDRWTRFYDLIDNFPLISRPQRGWKEAAVYALELQGHERVLDIGTGSGQILTWIAPCLTDGMVIGTDISHGMVKIARERIERKGLKERTHAVYDDIEHSSFPDDHFDRIIATFTFTTIPDPIKAAKECARLLKPDGSMIILDTGKPRGKYAWPLFVPMMLSAKLFGRTHMDRDIRELLEKRFEVNTCANNFLGMVYLLKCTSL